jgi:hypothetical protein
MKMGRNSRASSNRWVGFDVSSKKNAGSQTRRFCTATNVNAIDGISTQFTRATYCSERCENESYAEAWMEFAGLGIGCRIACCLGSGSDQGNFFI